MKKKGQVTMFVIIGIVIVALIVLAISFRGKIYTPATTDNLNSIMNDIDNDIGDCLESSLDEYVKKIGLQGGYLNPSSGSYRLWNDTTISYLCYNQVGKRTCTNRMLTEQDMEEQLANVLKELFPMCFDLEDDIYGRGSAIKTFNVVSEEPEFSVDITQSSVFTSLKFPLTLKAKNSDNVASKEEFSAKIDAPLGELYQVSQDILDAETMIGYFDVMTYILIKTGRYTIYPHKPYPDKIYQIKLREGNYFFQFAVEGESS